MRGAERTHGSIFKCVLAAAVAAALWNGGCAAASGAPHANPASDEADAGFAKIEERTSRTVLKQFATCLYRHNTQAARALLGHSDPKSLDMVGKKIFAQLYIQNLRLGSCLGDAAWRHGAVKSTEPIRVKLSPLYLRALIEEEDYLAQNATALPPPEGAAEALSRIFVSQGDDREQARSLAAFADCVVFHGPAQSDALLRTEPASEQEKAAIKSLLPLVPRCVAAGQSLKLTPVSLRAFVADGLWSRRYFKGQ